MKIFSKIKHLNIRSIAIGVLSSGRAKLNNLSKKNKAIVATGLSVITAGGIAVATSSIVNNKKVEKEIDNSIIFEVDSNDDNITEEVYGPKFYGELSNSAKDNKDEKEEEFLSDELKDEENKDEEDKKEEIKEDITNTNDNVVIVKEYNSEVVPFVEDVQGEEIVERVEYSKDVTVVDGKAYETEEDANRHNQEIGSVEIVDNNNYVQGPDGDYYISNEDINNINMGEVITEDISSEEEVEEEINLEPFFQDPDNPEVRWGSERDYLLVKDPTYGMNFDIDAEEEKYIEETQEETNFEDIELIISDDSDIIYLGPDGTICNSLEEYNSKFSKYEEEAVTEEVKEETKEEVKEETKEETKEEVRISIKLEEEEKTVRDEEDKNDEPKVAEPIVADAKVVDEINSKLEVGTNSESKDIEEDEASKFTNYEFDILELLEDDIGKIQDDGDCWVSDEDYNLVHNQEETVSKTR